MNDSSYKPSLYLNDIISENIRIDSERFLLFTKAYYEWLQTVKITIENGAGTFVRDEIIVGSTTKASAIVKQVGSNFIIVRMNSLKVFDLRETIVGQTSDAEATITEVKDNVLRKSGKLLDYRNPETTVDDYVEYLKNELYPSIPNNILSDKRLLASKFKEFYQSRSNESSYRFLFRILYGQEIELRYPGEDLLRVSDGNFEKRQVIRAAITDDIFDFLNQTITGGSSGAIGNVVDIVLIFVGTIQCAEMTLALVSGTFAAGETISTVVVDSEESISTQLYGIVSAYNIVDGGSGYAVGDTVTITGDGQQATATVSSIQDSPITAITVNTPGYGYRLNTNAIVNNTGTGGTGFAVRVTELANTYTVTDANTSTTYTVGETATISVINRGTNYFAKPTITLTDTTISSLGLLSSKLITIANTGNNYAVGDSLVFTGGSGANAAGQVASVTESISYDLLFEDGFRMLSEDSYDDTIKNEDWSVEGPILRIELTNFGDGYTSANLPSISVTSANGSGANLVATGIQGIGANVEVDVANNSTGIGSIRAIQISNFGIDYSSANADLTASGDGNANVQLTVAGLGIGDGDWIDDDGKIDYKILQDSFFYQDFSYVVRSGLAFSSYKEILKKTIHPAGLELFGEILISSFFSVSPNFRSTILPIVQNANEYLVYIFSFGQALVQPIPSFRELEFELLANEGNANLDVSTSVSLILETDIDSALQFAGLINEYRVQPTFDAINVSIDTTSTEVELNIPASNVDVSIQDVPELEVYLILENDVDAQSTLGTNEYNLEIPVDIDVSSVNKESKVEINLGKTELDLAIVSGLETEYQLKINSDISNLGSIGTNEYILKANTSSLQVLSSIESKYVLDLQTQSFANLSFTQPFEQITYGDIQISVLQNVPISTYANTTFGDSYESYITQRLIKVAGTVSTSGSYLIGNGTSFTSDFSANDNIIVANQEKFIVSAIANNTFITLNVPSVSSYNDVSAYRESF